MSLKILNKREARPASPQVATLRQAVDREVLLRIKYFPNKDGQVRVGFRTILPLDIYTYRGIEYLLAWFSKGSSVSGEGDGYRLYFTKRIQEWEEADRTTQQPFAMKAAYRDKPKLRVKAWMMVRTGEVE